jgi:ubiquitin
LVEWTPGESDGGTSPTVTVSLTDGVDTVQETFTIEVAEVNQAPVLVNPGTQNASEGSAFSLQLDGSDDDLPAQTLTFAKVSGPAALTVSATGLVEWTPGESDGGTSPTVTVSLTDGIDTVQETFTIEVAEVNQAPVLVNPGTQNASEGSAFSLQLDGSDDDLPAQTLTFAKVSGPAALTVSATGLVEWTPGESDGGTSPTVTVSLTDGVDTVQETFTIEVAEVNQAPVLVNPGTQNASEGSAFSLQLDGSDDDLPAQTLTFAKVSGPAALTVSATGLVEWTPGESDGGTSPTVTVSLTDGIDTVQETFTIEVAEVNQAPVLVNPGTQNTSEGSAFSLQLDGTDDDLPAQTLTFAKVSGPAALTVSATGLVEWTPGESDGGTSPTVTVSLTDGIDTVQETFTIEVEEVNAPPVWSAIPNQSAQEHAAFSLDLTPYASDANDIPANNLTFALVSGPAGLTVSPAGLVEWTPGETDGGTNPTVTVQVTDDGVPNLTVQASFSIEVEETNDAPVLDPIGDKNVDEHQLLTFTATASDPDLPAQNLTFSLDPGAPTGASITPAGVFTWTPTEAQGPGVYSVTVRVTDDGDPALSDTETIQITVAEIPDQVTLELTIQHHYPLEATGPITRGLIIRLGGTGGPNAPLILDRDVTFDATGTATLVFTAADGLMDGADFSRISVKDPLHTLRATVVLNETGPDQYEATAVLRGGNLNKDDKVDIGDYVVLALRFGDNVVPDTPFDVPGNPPTHLPNFRHADINGDGEVNIADFALISDSWGILEDDEVGNFSASNDRIRKRISVIDAIAESGSADAAKLDLDGDGWITLAELPFFR